MATKAKKATESVIGLGKEELLALGVHKAEQFLNGNKLPHPKFVVDNDMDNFGRYAYKNRTVSINLKRCRTPVKIPGFAWSYPGWKADLTPVGVVAHEVGHHVYHLLKSNKDFDAKKWREVLQNEPRVSAYEPNMDEAYAEAIKLFITNPNLLKVGRPLRYALLNSMLDPVHDFDWRKVIAEAHPKFIAAGLRWIDRSGSLGQHQPDRKVCGV